ncbi:MAG: hypothetical protein EPN23_01510 [Verrucomicrobia bacterium]|nr:MAG: hypothetical protein EPN23_01510 [Verrucomicrobiota bacterium]
MHDVPKLLVIACFHPDRPHGGAHVMRQLLRDYPKDRLAWWCLDANAIPAGFLPREQVYRMRLPLAFVAREKYRWLKNSLAERLWVPVAARQLTAVLDHWDPEGVVFLPQAWLVPVFLRIWSAQKHRSLHLVLHDFLDHAGCRRSLGSARASCFMHSVEGLYPLAQSRTTISRAMADELQHVTGCAAELIAPCGVEPDELSYVRTRRYEPAQGEISLVYTGTVTAPATMLRLVQALEQVRVLVGRPIVLRFYGGLPVQHHNWFRAAWMRFEGTPSDAQLRDVLRSACFGLCLMNDDLSNPRYDRYSIPCKFTTYLAAGLPMIVVGHPATTLAGIMRKYPTGLWLGHSHNMTTWVEQLVQWFNGSIPYAAIQAAMVRAAKNEFDAERNRKIFNNLLSTPVRHS